MNNFFTFNIQDIAVILLYIIGALFLCQKFSSNKDYRLKMIPYLMALLHLVCAVSYYFLLLNAEGDARGYYLGATQRFCKSYIIPFCALSPIFLFLLRYIIFFFLIARFYFFICFDSETRGLSLYKMALAFYNAVHAFLDCCRRERCIDFLRAFVDNL
jgi:hypothetical protein